MLSCPLDGTKAYRYAFSSKESSSLLHCRKALTFPDTSIASLAEGQVPTACGGCRPTPWQPAVSDQSGDEDTVCQRAVTRTWQRVQTAGGAPARCVGRLWQCESARVPRLSPAPPPRPRRRADQSGRGRSVGPPPRVSDASRDPADPLVSAVVWWPGKRTN